MQTIPIYIGWDEREAAAYHVCCQSILQHATVPVAFVPLSLRSLRGYTETHSDGSNAFIYSRFLVPWLMNFQGHALFLDGDMLVRDDIAKLWDLRRYDRGVQVVQHDYKTRHPVKYLQNKNEDYPRKNWSSVVLFNCGYFPNRKLTPEFVAQSDGAYLHRFSWLRDSQIGALPAEWNHLCMEYDERPDAKLLHYTVGIPGFPEYADQEGGHEWQRAFRAAQAPVGGPISTAG